MKKTKIMFCAMFGLFAIILSACGTTNISLADYLIEHRNNLFTSSDNLYSVSFSTGLREKDYNFDGEISELIPFGILTLTRNDGQPLANDVYSYIVTIDGTAHSGYLEKSTNNSFSADLEVNTTGKEEINVQISFTGYTYKQNLENTGSNFQVDSLTAIKVAENELKKELQNLLKDKNVKIEVVMKIMKDYSIKESKNYYWYVGIISTSGNTMGILIDAQNGDIIAKKV